MSPTTYVLSHCGGSFVEVIAAANARIRPWPAHKPKHIKTAECVDRHNTTPGRGGVVGVGFIQ
jgi:hypothetical protein